MSELNSLVGVGLKADITTWISKSKIRSYEFKEVRSEFPKGSFISFIFMNEDQSEKAYTNSHFVFTISAGAGEPTVSPSPSAPTTPTPTPTPTLTPTPTPTPTDSSSESEDENA